MLRTCLIALALMPGASVVAQEPSPAAASYVKPAPPGELVDIGGRQLHIECKGPAEGATVIFEAGLSQYTAHSTFGKAQDLIASFAQACVYDRAGLGWSDAVSGARTQADMVEDLQKLVAAKRLNAPLVLVGHSMGGLLVRLYAKEYPSDVAAIVLLDASSEPLIFGPGGQQGRQAAIAQIDAGPDIGTSSNSGSLVERAWSVPSAILTTIKTVGES